MGAQHLVWAELVGRVARWDLFAGELCTAEQVFVTGFARLHQAPSEACAVKPEALALLCGGLAGSSSNSFSGVIRRHRHSPKYVPEMLSAAGCPLLLLTKNTTRWS